MFLLRTYVGSSCIRCDICCLGIRIPHETLVIYLPFFSPSFFASTQQAAICFVTQTNFDLMDFGSYRLVCYSVFSQHADGCYIRCVGTYPYTSGDRSLASPATSPFERIVRGGKGWGGGDQYDRRPRHSKYMFGGQAGFVFCGDELLIREIFSRLVCCTRTNYYRALKL